LGSVVNGPSASPNSIKFFWIGISCFNVMGSSQNIEYFREEDMDPILFYCHYTSVLLLPRLAIASLLVRG
jgi:hypothetical protein